MEEEKVFELQGGCASGSGAEMGGAVAAGPGLLGEGNLMLPPHSLASQTAYLSLFQLLFLVQWILFPPPC